ncbi:hypothetical protein GALLN_00564 [Gallionellaceae bacterium]|nr:hypothetical protein GALLN_00564 [Gallionellaceae bacterium]
MKKAILHFVLIFISFPALAELEVITLQHRNAQDVLPIIQPLLDQDDVARGMNNKLILRTSPRNLAEIRKLLEQIDTAPRSLKITVMQNVDSETVRRLTEVSGSIGLSGDARIGMRGGRDEGGLTVEAGQGADRARARVYSTRSLDADKKTQQIQVLEGGRARISVGQAVPVTQRQVVRSPWKTRVIEDTQYREVSSGFYVVPRLNGDRVTLEISAQNDMLSPGSANQPATSVQQMTTTISGRLGEWLVLGETLQQTEGEGSSISRHSLSSAHEQRNVLLMVEEIK